MASRVSRAIRSTAACAPMKKSGSGDVRVPPARRYETKHLPARNAAAYGRSKRTNSSSGSAPSSSSMRWYPIDTSAYTMGLIATRPSRLARASAALDHVIQAASPVMTSSRTFESTRTTATAASLDASQRHDLVRRQPCRRGVRHPFDDAIPGRVVLCSVEVLAQKPPHQLADVGSFPCDLHLQSPLLRRLELDHDRRLVRQLLRRHFPPPRQISL